LKRGMSRKHNMPNQENCTLEELDTAVKAAPIQRTNLRLMAIKALTLGLSLIRVLEISVGMRAA